MALSLDIWLLPAIAAASSSYLVSLCWERVRRASAPTAMMASFLSALSFFMGAICAQYRFRNFSVTLENNIIVMFLVGASTTYVWLLLRRYILGLGKR